MLCRSKHMYVAVAVLLVLYTSLISVALAFVQHPTPSLLKYSRISPSSSVTLNGFPFFKDGKEEIQTQLAQAEELMKKGDYEGVKEKAKAVLDELEPQIPLIAQAAKLQGKAIMSATIDQTVESGEKPSREVMEKVYESYDLSKKLNPNDEESERERYLAGQVLQKLDTDKEAPFIADYDVVIIGAGASGVGTAFMLTDTFGLDRSRVILMERGPKVGESFRRWPEEMRFISPSFNQQGWTNSFDLNSVAIDTSPAFSFHTEHPTGKEYANYLASIARISKLNVKTSTEVVSVDDIGYQAGENAEKLPLFAVKVRSVDHDGDEASRERMLTARYIVWAAGEFQYPKGRKNTNVQPTNDSIQKSTEDNGAINSDEELSTEDFPGEHLCMHNTFVKSWAKLPGDDYIIIGGYESGVDAAVNLSRAGKECKILASTPCWSVKTDDPSTELAPYTASRLREVLAPGFSPKPQLYAPLRVVSVEKVKEGGDDSGYRVTAEWKALEDAPEIPNLRKFVNRDVGEEAQGEVGSTIVLHTPNSPILCTGFEGSVAASASHLFDFTVDIDKKGGCLEGAPVLTPYDESTKIPGVFLVGPAVAHGSLSFCFVYKFRQRFAIVAREICQGLGIDTRSAVSECTRSNMFMDDFSCCEDTCGDVC